MRPAHRPTSAGLLVKRVLVLEFAILHLLQALGSIAFLLFGRIIATLALGAFQNYQFARHGRKLFLLGAVPPG